MSRSSASCSSIGHLIFGALSVCAVIEGNGSEIIEGSSGDGVSVLMGRGCVWVTPSPRPAWIYRIGTAPAGGLAGAAPGWGSPQLLPCAGSSRRSGRIPALPYPPLEQRACFPFPFP